MAQISSALRERLLGQKKAMESGGMIIKAKTFIKGRFRILPCHEELPGIEYVQLYSKVLKKSTTSPRTFGVACPVMDELERIFREESKADKDAAADALRRSTEYWLAVIDRENEGTVDNPNVRILPGRKSVYQEIVGWMIDEDVGVDVTHPKEGFDIVVRKEGSGLETEWTCMRAPAPSPISEDPEMAKAWIELASRFDVRSKFYGIKLDVLNEMYDLLTGEDIPSRYMDDIQAVIAGQTVEDDESASVPDEEEVVEVHEEESDGGWIGTRVSFEDDESVEHFGKVVAIDTDAESEGNLMIAEDGEDPDEQWSIPPADCTPIEEEEPEPEPAPAPKKKSKSKKKAATKPKAAAKTTKKAAATKNPPRKPRSGGAAAKIGKKVRG